MLWLNEPSAANAEKSLRLPAANDSERVLPQAGKHARSEYWGPGASPEPGAIAGPSGGIAGFPRPIGVTLNTAPVSLTFSKRLDVRATALKRLA